MVHALDLDDTVFRIGTSKIFFKAGVLAELEERRDILLFDIFSRLQAAARRFAARRQMKKILNRALAIRTIQKNARVYGELREWSWWQLYTKVWGDTASCGSNNPAQGPAPPCCYTNR